MSRLVDRGAITAAYVGIGMAVTIGVSFMLFIPIESVHLAPRPAVRPADRLLREPALRSARRAVAPDPRQRPVRRVRHRADRWRVLLLVDQGALLLRRRRLSATPSQGGRVTVDKDDRRPPARPARTASTSATSQAGRGADLVAAGVTDAGSFTTFYWNEQFGSAGHDPADHDVGGLGGAALYGVFRPKPIVAAETTVRARPD